MVKRKYYGLNKHFHRFRQTFLWCCIFSKICDLETKVFMCLESNQFSTWSFNVSVVTKLQVAVLQYHPWLSFLLLQASKDKQGASIDTDSQVLSLEQTVYPCGFMLYPLIRINFTATRKSHVSEPLLHSQMDHFLPHLYND